MLLYVLLGIVALVAGFLLLVATRDPAYRVERTLTVAAPADVVFDLLNDLRAFSRFFVLFGSPQEQLDPNVRRTFAGPTTGVGHSCAWSGNRDVGTGTMTIEQSVPAQRVVVQIAFTKPMASTSLCELTLTPAPGGVQVRWSMAGNHNFLGKAVGVFLSTDKMLGADIDKGLALLQTEATRAGAGGAAG